MRTLIGAAEPDEPRPQVVPILTAPSGWSMTWSSEPPTTTTTTVTAWVESASAPEPYRTTAHVGRPIPELGQ